MNILVEYQHCVEAEYHLYLFDTDKMDLNSVQDTMVKKAIDTALADKCSQVDIDGDTSDAIEQALCRNGSYISFILEGKMIDKHIFMFWGN